MSRWRNRVSRGKLLSRVQQTEIGRNSSVVGVRDADYRIVCRQSAAGQLRSIGQSRPAGCLVAEKLPSPDVVRRATRCTRQPSAWTDAGDGPGSSDDCARPRRAAGENLSSAPGRRRVCNDRHLGANRRVSSGFDPHRRQSAHVPPVGCTLDR